MIHPALKAFYQFPRHDNASLPMLCIAFSLPIGFFIDLHIELLL